MGGGCLRCAAATLWACLPLAVGLVRGPEKDALVAFYEATNGAEWGLHPLAPHDETINVQPWDTSTDPCPKNYTDSWHGVSCVDPCYYPIDGDDCRFGRITGLVLPFNNITGTIPDSLFDNLINLTIVDFSHNEISGTLPTTVGRLRNLMTLQLSHNRLSGTIPTEIRTMGSHVPPDENAWSLSDIAIPPETANGSTTFDYESKRTMGFTHLDLAHNLLNGTLPTTIGELINLQSVDVSNNPQLGADGCCNGTDSYYQSFYGYNTTLPTEIGQLTKLQVLNMDWSRFMRQIPTEVGNMKSLEFWRLQGSWETNQVSGTIPSQFGNLKNLVEFMMENNTLSGTLPNELSGMSSLETFSVQDNRLSGSLPEDMGNLSMLQHWDSFGNKLIGDMPTSVEKLGNLQYFYFQNEHSDAIRNYYCQQRIEASAVGRKFNWQVVANEFRNYRFASACANPYDVHKSFEALSGDV